ncbi:MAG: polysulfide reductase NrfD [Burkholderiales bacterium]|nr:polysulfide reductase NrfD [Burkholderiales bacterium]
MAESLIFRELAGTSRRYWGLLALLAVPLALAAFAYFYIEHYGHIVTGMDNQIVWGMPHVFAVFLVVAATGALNIAMAASVFGKVIYRPVAPLSALVSLALLVGGLALLMLDLGRSDRLIVAITKLNPASLFARRVIFYDVFMVSVGVYLWFLLERRMNRYVKPVAVIAFLSQLFLITTTGLEFGFNFRAAYDSLLYAPMFIAFASAYGTAMFVLILFAVCGWEGRSVSEELSGRLKNLLGMSVAASLFLAVLFLSSKYELLRSRDVARFMLFDGGVYTALLWLGQLAIGGVLPLALLLRSRISRATLAAACVLVVAGGLAQMYVTLIGGQAYPQILFPGLIESSSYFDGQIHPYTPTFVEIFLGLGGVALAAAILAVGLRAVALLPERLDQPAQPQA